MVVFSIRWVFCDLISGLISLLNCFGFLYVWFVLFGGFDVGIGYLRCFWGL